MKKKFRLLRRNKLIRNIFIVASGTALAQVITFLITPFITRMYGPDAFGILGTFTATVNIIGPLAALTYPIAVVLPKSDHEAINIMKLSMIISIVLAALTSVFLVFFDDFINLFDLSFLSPYLYLLPIVIVISAFLQINEQWIIRTKQYRIAAKTAILQSVMLNSSKLIMGFLHPFASSLLLLQTLGIAFKGSLMYHLAGKSAFRKRSYRKNRLLSTANKHKDFPLFRAPQVLLNSISQGLPTILLGSFFGPSAAGFYALGVQALGTPVQLLGKAVQDVFYPRLTEAANNSENIGIIIKKSVLGLAVLGIIPFGSIVIFGPLIFSFIFGVQWKGAGEYAQWIALVSYIMLITRPIIVAIPVLKVQKQFLVFELISTLIKSISLIIGFKYFKSDMYSVALFSVVSLIFYLILALYVFFKAKRFNKK